MARTGAAVAVAYGLLGCAVAAQTLNPSPREVLGLRRSLTDAETSLVLAAARQAAAGRRFQLRVRPDGPGPLFVMRDDGRPRYLQMTSGADVVEGWSSAGSSPEQRSNHVNVTTFIHYTGTQAHGCGGTIREGELVIEYENRNAGWTAKARVRSAVEVNDAAFAMLAGEVAVMSGARKEIGGRAARAFVAAYRLPPGAMGGPPPGTTQSLWIDVESLLPVQWTISLPAVAERNTPTLPEFGALFVYDGAIDLHPPNVSAPDCIR